MGEKIKDISSFQINDNVVKIELNNGWDKNYAKYDIHIQSKSLQILLTNADFIKFAATMKLSEKVFEESKKTGGDNNE